MLLDDVQDMRSALLSSPVWLMLASSIALADDGLPDAWDAGELAIAAGTLIAIVLVLWVMMRHVRGGSLRAALQARSRESASAAAVHQMSSALDLIHDAVAVVDHQRRIIWANRAMARALDVPAEAVSGVNLSDVTERFGIAAREVDVEGGRLIVLTPPQVRAAA
jgi:PAS domain-containing protein